MCKKGEGEYKNTNVIYNYAETENVENTKIINL